MIKTPVYHYEEDTCDSKWEITEAMIEGLCEPTDREKFEECMRKLSSLNGSSTEWRAFDNLTLFNPDEANYEDYLKVVSNYLFG